MTEIEDAVVTSLDGAAISGVNRVAALPFDVDGIIDSGQHTVDVAVYVRTEETTTDNFTAGSDPSYDERFSFVVTVMMNERKGGAADVRGTLYGIAEAVRDNLSNARFLVTVPEMSPMEYSGMRIVRRRGVIAIEVAFESTIAYQ